MLRSLTYHWRLNLAVSLGAAVTTAVLTGALLVGDSMRGSLATITQDRLGQVGLAVLSERWLPERVAGSLADRAGLPPAASPAPMLRLRGSAVHAESGARASSVNVLGIDGRFAGLYESATTASSFPSPGGPLPDAGGGAAGAGPYVVINESLARQLEAQPGEDILLRVPRPTVAPPDTLLGRRDADRLVSTLRATVQRVIPDRGAGRFDLATHQTSPLNAYLLLADVQRALGRPGLVNAILMPRGEVTVSKLEEILATSLDMEAFGLIVSRSPERVTVESRDFVLRPDMVEAIEGAASALGGVSQPLLTYLAIEIRSGDRSVPYSTITAIDDAGPQLPWLERVEGGRAPTLGPGEILLNEWAAEDLRARTGDEIVVTYFTIVDREQLHERTASFRLKGVVAHSGLAADPTLTPDYPGIGDAPDIASWDPPFPVDFRMIRQRDEEYWDRFMATPKAFVSRAAGERLWANRYGRTTAVRLMPPAGQEAQLFSQHLAAELRRRLPIASAGLSVRDVRREAESAGAGSTDFGALFIAFSSFLIIAAALLTGLLFRLGVERRAAEIGTLLALGYRPGQVRARFLAEGLLLAAAGAGPGIAGGSLYAGLLLAGLRTIWRDAVGTTQLHLHVPPASLAIGAVVSMSVVAVSILSAVARLSRRSIPELLAGRFGVRSRRPPGRRAGSIAVVGLCGAAALLALSRVRDAADSPSLYFGTGVCLLVSALALFSAWSGRAGRRAGLRPGAGWLVSLATRNCSWSPGRSLLCVALIGCASFVIVTVAASGHHPEIDVEPPGPGTGGYRLVADADIPLHHDLDKPIGRAALGLVDDRLFEGFRAVSLPAVAGDDVSCLNLYRPERPRLLGVPRGAFAAGRFRFGAVERKVDDPWSLLDEPIDAETVPVIGDHNSVLWILHRGLGQDLVVSDEAGRPLRLRFVGLLERSLFQSELLISEEALMKHFPSRSGRSFFLIETTRDHAAALTPSLETSLAAYGFDVSPAADRLAGYLTVESAYLQTFQALGGLGLLLGTVGVAVVLLRNVVERRGELAAMRSFGFRRATLARMILLESATLLACGTAAGALSAVASAAPRLSSDGAPWGSISMTLAAVLVVGMLSSMAALRVALRAELIVALKEER